MLRKEEPLDRRILTAHAAVGGITNFYQSANARFEYSEFIGDEHIPTEPERLVWIREFVTHLEPLHARQVLDSRFMAAVQTRIVIGTMLDEFKALLDKMKSDQP